MRVLITGANGFVGRELVRCLLARGSLRGQPIDALLVLDRDLHGLPDDSRVRRHFGSVTDPALMRRVLADGIDVVFHLVSIPGGLARSATRAPGRKRRPCRTIGRSARVVKDGIAMRIDRDDHGTVATLERLAIVLNDAALHSLPVFLEPFMSSRIEGRVRHELTPEAVVRALSIAQAIGATSAWTPGALGDEQLDLRMTEERVLVRIDQLQAWLVLGEQADQSREVPQEVEDQEGQHPEHRKHHADAAEADQAAHPPVGGEGHGTHRKARFRSGGGGLFVGSIHLVTVWCLLS